MVFGRVMLGEEMGDVGMPVILLELKTALAEKKITQNKFQSFNQKSLTFNICIKNYNNCNQNVTLILWIRNF